MTIIVRAALLGLATGSRSTIGLAALTTTGPARSTGRRWARRGALAAAAGELIGDKLAQTPSRLEPPGVAARLGLGAAGAAMLARREGNSPMVTVLAAVTGLAAAGMSTRLGARWRAVAAGRFGRDLPGALIEDAACLGLARAASSH